MASYGPKNPCYDCKPPVRHPGCHGKCEKYLAFKKDWDERNEAIRKNMMASREVSAYIKERMNKQI